MLINALFRDAYVTGGIQKKKRKTKNRKRCTNFMLSGKRIEWGRSTQATSRYLEQVTSALSLLYLVSEVGVITSACSSSLNSSTL